MENHGGQSFHYWKFPSISGYNSAEYYPNYAPSYQPPIVHPSFKQIQEEEDVNVDDSANYDPDPDQRSNDTPQSLPIQPLSAIQHYPTPSPSETSGGSVTPPEKVEGKKSRSRKRSNPDGESSKSKTRKRTNFTQAQLDSMEMIFSRSHYPDITIVEDMARRLNLPEDRISVWFQNRRARFKRQKSEQMVWMRQQFFQHNPFLSQQEVVNTSIKRVAKGENISVLSEVKPDAPKTPIKESPTANIHHFPSPDESQSQSSQPQAPSPTPSSSAPSSPAFPYCSAPQSPFQSYQPFGYQPSFPFMGANYGMPPYGQMSPYGYNQPPWYRPPANMPPFRQTSPSSL